MMIRYMMWYDMIWYDMIWYDVIWYDMIWYDIWYGPERIKGYNRNFAFLRFATTECGTYLPLCHKEHFLQRLKLSAIITVGLEQGSISSYRRWKVISYQYRSWLTWKLKIGKPKNQSKSYYMPAIERTFSRPDPNGKAVVFGDEQFIICSR